MMKTLIRTLAYCSLLAVFTACERDLEPYSSTDCRLNFVYLDYTGEVMTSDRVTEAERTASYSFITAGAGSTERITTDTLWFDVSTMGFLSDQNRPVRLEQVSTGEDDAIPGVHYVSFDDPDFTRLCFVPANQNRTQVPVIVLRDASLEEHDVTLVFRFAENEYFKPGYTGLTERTLHIADRLLEPGNWSQQYFGTYGPVKHQLMIDWTGEVWDESYIRSLLNGDSGYLSYLKEFFQQKLEEENAKRQEAGLDIYREADGSEIRF